MSHFSCHILDTVNGCFLCLPSRSDRSQGRARSGDSLFGHTPVVIPATPTNPNKNRPYSVYGSPDINYSRFYSLPPGQAPVPPVLHGRDDADHAYFHASAVESRSADDFERRRNFDVGQKTERRRPQGGGIQYIDPPNKAPIDGNDYYYYSDDSPFYKVRLSIKPSALKKKSPKKVLKKVKKRLRKSDVNRLDREGGEGENELSELLRTLPNDQPVFPKPSKQAVIYSFRNERGQKRKVGVIYDPLDVGPQVDKVFGSQRREVFKRGSPAHPPPAVIPISGVHTAPATRAPQLLEPSHQDIVGGRVHHVYHGVGQQQSPQQQQQQQQQQQVHRQTYQSSPPHPHIPLVRSNSGGGGGGGGGGSGGGANNRVKVYPLGNPYGSPVVHDLPNYFPVQKRPPIYRTRPQRLEGVFGPALPPKPEPTHLNFPGQGFEYGPRAQEPRTVRREDSSSSPQVVYKTVRDMDYTRPPVIMHVKDSGELFVPGKELLNPLVQPEPPATLINLPLQELRRNGDDQRPVQQSPAANFDHVRRGEPVRRSDHGDFFPVEEGADEEAAAAREAQWLADFSDAYQDEANVAPKLPQAEQQFPLTEGVSPLNAKGQSHKDDSDKADPPPVQGLDQEESDDDARRQLESPKRKASSSFSFPTSPKRRRQEPRSPSVNIRPFSQLKPKRKVQESNSEKQLDPFKRSPVHEQEEKEELQTVTPNYRVVYGASYNSEPVVKAAEKEESDSQPKYTKDELYQLCIKEVPDYLRHELCHHVLEQKPAQARFSDVDVHESLRDQQQVENAPEHLDPVIGIPVQLPKQTKKRLPPKLTVRKSPTRVTRYSGKSQTDVPTVAPAPAETEQQPAKDGEETVDEHEDADEDEAEPETQSPALRRPPSSFLQGITNFFRSHLQLQQKRQQDERRKQSNATAIKRRRKILQDQIEEEQEE